MLYEDIFRNKGNIIILKYILLNDCILYSSVTDITILIEGRSFVQYFYKSSLSFEIIYSNVPSIISMWRIFFLSETSTTARRLCLFFQTRPAVRLPCSFGQGSERAGSAETYQSDVDQRPQNLSGMQQTSAHLITRTHTETEM